MRFIALILLMFGAVISAQSPRPPSVSHLVPIGAGIYEVAVGAATDAVYVASTGADARRIFVLDPATLAVKTTIDTADRSAFGLAFNNRTQTLYTSSTTSNSVSAIDVKSGRTLATITAPGGGVAHVFRVLVDEESNTVYVSLPDTSSRIWVIDGATNTLRHEIPNVGGRSTGLALDRAQNRLFTCSIASSEIIEIDLTTRQVVRRFPSGGVGTTHLVLDAKANRLFASHQRSGDITVLDVRTGEVLKTIATGAGALGLAMDEERGLLYVTNRGADTVSVIDTRTLTVIANLTGGALPNTVVVDARSGVAYVTFKARGDSPDSIARIVPASTRR
ncbi:MAG: YncE family protein [Acidobacteria bacterium]|nr:YncE family protein [Acidobacteriota bacterium]